MHQDLTMEKAAALVSERVSVVDKPRIRRRHRLNLRATLLAAGAAGLLAVAGWYGDYWWNTGRFMVSTDDAYLQADNVIISPKVSGYIADVAVQDNQPVHAGQVLARIDDRDYRTARRRRAGDRGRRSRRRSTT